jgi:DNA-binding IclR family transcriptional regulator
LANKRNATAVRSVKSAERVLTLLETIGATPVGTTFSQLNASLRIPKSSLHALLEVLTSRDYIELDPESRRYSLGVRVWETGYAYHRHHGVLKQAQEVLEKIVARVNETVQFAKLVGSENVYLAKVDSTHALRLQSDVGTRLQAHATGIGKALLAQLDDEEVRERFVRKDLPVYTANTIPTVSALLDELAIIRQRGFAVDNEEYSLGVFCAAVPVFGSSGTAKNALSVRPTSHFQRSSPRSPKAAWRSRHAWEASAAIPFSRSWRRRPVPQMRLRNWSIRAGTILTWQTTLNL